MAKAKTRVRTHPFRHNPELGADVKGQRYCADCPLAERHPAHQLPETTQEARDRDLAVLGEKEDA